MISENKILFIISLFEASASLNVENGQFCSCLNEGWRSNSKARNGTPAETGWESSCDRYGKPLPIFGHVLRTSLSTNCDDVIEMTVGR